ncbi:hypothetical protein [Asanoa sp. NPDC050611]|uniref:hypothetical protein n=1 Tax=Asanoa sp. NPDC050611 TaxID=3157098 RepID=UPI0033E38FD8
MAGLAAWIWTVLGGGRNLTDDQVDRARQRKVGLFAYEQANLLRDGKLSRAEAVDAIAEQFPELGREEAARALNHGLYESLW